MIPLRRVFLTGGTGMLGTHVAELLRARGCAVRILHRRGADTTPLFALGCELVEGDLRDAPDALAEAMTGCDGLVHAAAVTYGLPWAEVHAINVAGTERVLRAAARARVRAAVHFSSAAVYGDPRGRPDEDSPLDAPLGAEERYARSKREAEGVVHALAAELALPTAIVRPSVVYGARDRLFTPGLVRAFRFPVQFVLGDGLGVIPVVYAGNVADAALAALAAAAGSPSFGGGPGVGARSRVYDLADDHPITQHDLYLALAGALRLPFRPVHLPRAVVLGGARVGQALGIRVANAPEMPLHRAARFTLGPNPFGSRRIRAELGWAPPVPLADALARTARWADGARTELGLARR